MQVEKRKRSAISHEQLACGLGWFSIGLGVAQLLAPRKIGRACGAGDHPTLMRLLGLREIASGIGILTVANPARWLKARVGGDLLDLTLLGVALTSGRPGRAALAAAAVAGVTALDVRATRQFAGNPGANLRTIRVTRTITVGRPPEELFQFWRNFENLPRFMNHLKSVSTISPTRSHWIAKGPADSSVEWDAEIVNEHPNELIAWRSIPGSDVDNSGSVRFSRAPGGRGTYIKVELWYDPPAGRLGSTIAKLFGQDPQKQIAVDLHRFKQLIETGEIARTEGQPSGRTHSTSRKYDDLVRAGV